MARLLPGEDPKIDLINKLVADARGGDKVASQEGLRILLEMFHPMILRICKRWSIYFEDYDHNLKPFDILIADAQFWFMGYTMDKYELDGPATYNNFIKNHINQRVRYLFEEELKYAKRNLFPDPDKNMADSDMRDMYEEVVHKYGKCSNTECTVDEQIIDDQNRKTQGTLASAILFLLGDRRYFTQREERIFLGCGCGDITHEAMGKELRISRTRVSQILKRVKDKLMNRINEDVGAKRLVRKWLA